MKNQITMRIVLVLFFMCSLVFSQNLPLFPAMQHNKNYKIPSSRQINNSAFIKKSLYKSLKQSQNIRLVAHVNDHSQTGYSDCWGYTAPDGSEYALLGVNNGVSVIDVSDTLDIKEISFFEGRPNSDWQDLKTYKHYAYIVNDIEGGMDILDLSGLPDQATKVKVFDIQNFHNQYIDTSTALMYLADAAPSGSVHIYNLTDPENPEFLNQFGTEAHDLFVQNGVAYVAEGTQGTIGFYDVNDPNNVSLITSLNIPSAGYVHQVWITKNNKYMVTTEETYQKSIKIWDIQDLGNIELLSEYSGGNELAHNAYFHQDYLYVSHYESGIKVFDVSDPADIREIGFYDTYPADDGHNFNGTWGAYPFTQNGLIYISDVQSGLYVFRFEQQQGPQIVANNVDFGKVFVNAVSDTQTITIQNMGTETLTISALSQPDDQFVIINQPAVPFDIQPFNTISFMVIFTPHTEGETLEKIELSSNDSDDPLSEIELKGYGFIINPAEDNVFYAGTGFPNPSDFLTVNIDDGTVNHLGNTEIVNSIFKFSGEITGLAINSKGEIYCSAYYDPYIYKVDSKSGGVLKVVKTEHNLKALAFGPGDVLYAITIGSFNLYTIDLRNGKMVNLGALSIFPNSLAFDPVSGDLWVGKSSQELYRIDLNTLKSEKIGYLGLGKIFASINFDNHGNLYGLSGAYTISDFVSISKKDGKGTIIGSTGYETIYSISSIKDTMWMVKPLQTSINRSFLASEELKIQSKIFNPNNHDLTVLAILENPYTYSSDTLHLFDDGAHDDSTANDKIFGSSLPVDPTPGYYNVFMNVYPTDTGYLNNYSTVESKFTTSGPAVFEGFEITSSDTVANPGDRGMRFEIRLKNMSNKDTLFNITARVLNLDTCASVVAFSDPEYENIAPGQSAKPNRSITFNFASDCPAPVEIPFLVEISSDGYHFWSDTFYVHLDSTVTAIADKESALPVKFALDPNFPNPFNPTTTISYQLPKASDVELSIYNLLGQKITTLVKKTQQAGYYTSTWNASGYPSGMYYYQLRANGINNKKVFSQVRKLVVLK